MTLYKNKYRIESARLQSWDYSNPGFYFITICVRNRRCLFGEVHDGVMVLNKYGQIVHNEWEQTFEIRRNLMRDEFVVMPNHFHAIVNITGGLMAPRNVVVVEAPWHGASTTTTPTTTQNFTLETRDIGRNYWAIQTTGY